MDSALDIRLPFDQCPAGFKAEIMTGLGYYAVRLLDYTLPEEIPQDALRQPAGLQITGLDTVDQWSVGFLRDGIFHAYASAARRKQTPALPETLELPLLRGTVAVSVVDVLGCRTLWAAELP